MTNQLKVELSGPLFTKPTTTTVRGAQKKLVQRVSVRAKQEVQKQLRKGHGKESGAYRRSIKRKARKTTATVWSTNRMISGWLEDGGREFKGTRKAFQGYHIWSIATTRTDATAGAEARRIGRELARQFGGR